MFKQSIQHTFTKNQENSSMIEDKFSKGLGNMNHEVTFCNYADRLVLTRAKQDWEEYYLTLDMLIDDEKNELARLYIEYTDRDITECVHGSDLSINSDFTCALLAMLQNDCHASREAFANITIKNILIYYRDALEHELSQACERVMCNIMNEQGYRARYDNDHGDIAWSKYS
jgi:hypothetical protein